jgi:hypothetical protein
MTDQPTRAARRAARADAKNRSARTLLQGLAVDALVAAGAAATLVLSTWENDDILAATSWVVLGTAVAKSVLTAIASYISRLTVPPKE